MSSFVENPTSLVYPSIEQMDLSFFKGILLDSYGVIWGGKKVKVLPGAGEAMERLIANGKIVGILSNSTQLALKEQQKLEESGLFLGTHYHFLITSGEVAKTIFKEQKLPFPTPNKKYWPFCTSHDHITSFQQLFEETCYTEAKSLAESDFIYVTIPHVEEKDQIEPEVFREKVKTLAQTKLPMICTNPDLYRMDGGTCLVVRQGKIAQMYQEEGGQVFYIGKPHPKVYEIAMEAFTRRGLSSPQAILTVGDMPEMDIRGGHQARMYTALVTETGIFSERKGFPNLQKALDALLPSDKPDFLFGRLGIANPESEKSKNK